MALGMPTCVSSTPGECHLAKREETESGFLPLESGIW